MLWHFGQVAVMLHHWSTSQRHGTAYYKEDVGVYADHADYHEPGSYDEYDQEPGYYQEDPTYYADEEDPNGGEPFFDDPAHCEEPTATEEADLLNDEKEAYAIAQEANRTLQQARQAVAKARAARGYFPVYFLWEARTQAAARAEPQKARPTALAMCVGRWGTFFTNALSALRVEAVIRRQERQGQDRERQAEGEGEVLKRLLCHLP